MGLKSVRDSESLHASLIKDFVPDIIDFITDAAAGSVKGQLNTTREADAPSMYFPLQLSAQCGLKFRTRM